MKGAERPKTKGSSSDPRFLFFLETIRQPVTPKHPAWLRPLPLSRCAFSETAFSNPHADESISVGDYFQTVRSFLQGAGRDAVAAALERQGVAAGAPSVFRIFLAKHGAYYHPARLETESEGRALQWVINVAVSSAGKFLLRKEYAILKRLNRDFPVSYLPEVYVASEAGAGHGQSVELFMGEWLSGFHEFHLTRNTPDSEQALVLWDPENGCLPMDSGQAAAIYRQIARILTHYFNLTTFEGIGAWHHAAGDFVVKLSGNQPEVRLIAVRNYRPLFRSRKEKRGAIPDIRTLLQALLIFLLDLGIRTRLDRLDGTGEMTWSNPVAVEATVAGVIDGLSQNSTPFELPLPVDQLFKRYLAACDGDDLLEMCSAIAAKAFPLGKPEHSLLDNRLHEHAALLAALFSRL